MAHFNANSYEYVKSFIENEYSNKLGVKYKLLNSEYENNSTPLKIIDEDGFLFSNNFGSIVAGYKANAYPRMYYKNNTYTIQNMNHYIDLNKIDCELLSTAYVKTKSMLEFKCKCGKTFKTVWNEFKMGKQQCNACGRKTTFDIIRLDEQSVSNYISSYGCKLLSKYTNSKDIINIQCKCKNIFSTTLTDFKNRKYKSCSKCSKDNNNYIEQAKMRSYDNIKKFQDRCGNSLLTEYSVYTGMHSRINIKCKCGRVFDISASVGYKQTNCPECAKIKMANTRRTSVSIINKSIEESSKESGHIYKWISGEHTNRFSKIIIQDEVGYKYSTTVSSFTNGHRLNFSEFHQKNPFVISNINIWINNNAPGYKLLSTEYVSAKDYLIFQCPEGHIFKMNFDNFKQGQRCPECILSVGARMVLYHLRNLDLNFDIEHRFINCRGNRNPLPFDFVVFEKDDTIKCAIEFDGEMHYEPPRFSKNIDENMKAFARTKKYDKIKDIYCKNNNIPLLRIPYWERDNRNVENVIDEFLLELNHWHK